MLCPTFEIIVDQRPSYHIPGLDSHPYTHTFSVILNVKQRFQNQYLKLLSATL